MVDQEQRCCVDEEQGHQGVQDAIKLSQGNS
jgi:hypothetical protein